MGEEKVTPYHVPLIDLRRTGDNIRTLRKKAKLKESSLASLIGVSGPDVVSKWENGKQIPSIENLISLSYVLGVTIDEILAR